MQSQAEVIPFIVEGLLRVCGNILVILTVYVSQTKDGMLANIQSKKKQLTILWFIYLLFKFAWPLVSEAILPKYDWLSQGLTVMSVDPSYTTSDYQEVNHHLNTGCPSKMYTQFEVSEHGAF